MDKKKRMLIIMILITVIIILFFFLLAIKVFKLNSKYLIGRNFYFDDEGLSKVIKEEVKKESLSLKEYEIKVKNQKEKFANISFYEFFLYDKEDKLIDRQMLIYDEKDNSIIEFEDFFLEEKTDLLIKIINSAHQNKMSFLNKEVFTELSLDKIKAQKYKFEERGLNIEFLDFDLNISYRELRDCLNYDIFDIEKTELLKAYPLKERELSNYKDKDLIAFTFDDGPSSETLKLIEYAKQRDVRFTFFVLGSRVLEHEEILKDAYENAHQICNHSYSHASFNYLSPEELMNEINQTNELISSNLSIEIDCYRSPYGNLPAEYKDLIKMHEIRWNIDPEDWKYKDSEIIYEHILNHAHDGAIIVLHDLYPTTIEGSIKAIEELLKRNYAIVTIDEMAALKSVELKEGQRYFNFK